MPRERIDDPTNPGRYVQVNWRRQTDEPDQAPQYVQISTHHDGMSTVSRLIGWAIGIISNVDAPATGWPNQTDEWRKTARQWLDTAASHRSECTGEYVQVGPEEIDRLIKALHKAKRQAFGGECGQVPCDHAPDGGNHPQAVTR